MANVMVEDEDFKSSHQDLHKLDVESRNDKGDSNSSLLSAPLTTIKRQRQSSIVRRDDTDSSNTLSSGLKSPKKSVEFALDDHYSISNEDEIHDGRRDSFGSHEFFLPPSAAMIPSPSDRNKKPRRCASLTAKQLVDTILHSISPQERLDAVRQTKDCFDHNVQALHDDEITAGADAALVKHLVFLVWSISQTQQVGGRNSTSRMASLYIPLPKDRHDALISELCFTCEALESVFRASSETVGSSFSQCGEYVLQALITVVTDELERRYSSYINHNSNNVNKKVESDVDQNQHHDTIEHANLAIEKIKKESDGDSKKQSAEKRSASEDEEEDHSRPNTPPLHDIYGGLPGSWEGDIILRKATRTLGHFARVGFATQIIAHYPGLLGCLVKLISIQPQDCVPWEARLSALWTIANLACNNENMQMIVCTPGLLNALICIACRTMQQGDTLERTMEILRSRSIVARAVFNLSYLPENKITLAEHAALVDLLAELTVHRTAPLSRSQTVKEILTNTRRYAIGALRNLAAAPRRTKVKLCNYKNGRLFDVLTDAALNDSDLAVRDRAFAAVHNLANQDTSELIMRHPALVLALKDVLLSDEDESTENQEGTPKAHASATIMVLERTITSESSEYENLKDLLEAVHPTLSSDDQKSDDVVNAAEV